MLRAIRLVVGAAAVLFTSILWAQQPKDPPPANGYFPLKLKTKWVYKVGDNDVIVTVSKTEKVDKEEQFVVDTVVGKETKMTEWYAVRPDGVYRTKVKDDKLDPPVKVLPAVVKKDGSWDVNTKVGQQTIKGTMKVINDKEKIKVGDVEYETVLVEGKDMDVVGEKTTIRIWYAKDRGIVKEEILRQDGQKLQMELKEFSEGK